MPAIITNYLIVVDLHRLNVQKSTILPIQGPPVVDLYNLTQATALPSYTAGCFTLERVNSNDAAYHLRYDIHTHGQKLGFMYTDRTKKYGYDKGLRSLHIENAAFYTLPWGRELARFLKLFQLEVSNHSQVDICVYTQQLDPAKLIQRLTGKGGKAQRVMRKNDKPETVIGTMIPATGKMLNTTYYNKDSKTVTTKVYNKGQKLLIEPKIHIADWLHSNGFDPKKPTYSMETSIKARALKEYRSFAVTEDGEEISVYKADNGVSKARKQTEITSYALDIEKLDSPHYLAQLYQQFDSLDIRLKDASRPTNCTRIPLVDWTIYSEETINRTVTIRPTTNTLSTQKTMLKNLVNEYHETNDEALLAAAKAIAARHNLTEQLAKLLGKLPPAPIAKPAEKPAQKLAA